MGKLDGQVVIVTGGAGGIGSAYCRGLAAEGASLVVADLADGSEMVAEAEELGARAISVQVDVSDVASTEAMAAATVDAFGKIDALVNNAAFYLTLTQGPMEEISPEEWDRCFEVNVKGPWLCARAVAPTMRAQGSGKIVNIASMTVNDGTPGIPSLRGFEGGHLGSHPVPGSGTGRRRNLRQHPDTRLHPPRCRLRRQATPR